MGQRTKQVVRVGLGVGMIALVGAGLLWQRFTQLPSWYHPGQPMAQGAELDQAKRQIWLKVSNQVGVSRSTPDSPRSKGSSSGQVRLNDQELNTLLAAEILQSPSGQRLARALQGTHTQLGNHTLTVGAVVDLRAIRPQDLTGLEQTTLAKLVKTFPDIAKRPLYVGITTRPKASDRQLSLDPDTTVHIGEIQLSLTQVAQRLNLPPQRLLQELNRELASLVPMDIDSLEIQEHQLVLTGSATAW